MSANFARLQWIVGTPLVELALLAGPAVPDGYRPDAAHRAAAAQCFSPSDVGGRQRTPGHSGGWGRAPAAERALAVSRSAGGWLRAGHEPVGLAADERTRGNLWWELSSGGSGLFRLTGQTLPLGEYSLSFGFVTEDDELTGCASRPGRSATERRARRTGAPRREPLILDDFQTARLDFKALATGAPESSDASSPSSSA